jgi:hypothetical protein
VSDAPESEPPRRNRWVVVLLVVLPLWLFISAGIGLWLWYRGQNPDEVVEPSKFATPIEAGRLADDMHKLVGIIGSRHVGSESGAKGLGRAASMIQGSLGPSNAGYRIDVDPGPSTPSGNWPVIVATLPGDERAPLWVVGGYDTRGGGVEANSTGVASLIAVARALANERPGRPVKFAFLPHAYDGEAPVLRLLDQFTGSVGKADLMLVVEAMGAGEELLISSRESDALARPAFEKHGSIVGAEVICLEDDFDLASTLFELNQPAVRVATRRVVAEDEADSELPDPAGHAAASRRLAELVLELAG